MQSRNNSSNTGSLAVAAIAGIGILALATGCAGIGIASKIIVNAAGRVPPTGNLAQLTKKR